jgi:WD40 repeat protein
MPEQNVSRLNFNRGRVSQLALSRTDIERVELSAEEQTNFVPRVLGSMMLRPGLEYIDSTKDNAEAFHIPFVKSTDDTAIIELTDNLLRIRVDEDVIQSQAVSTTLRNTSFATDPAFTKKADPSTLPTGNANAIAFSPDKRLMAVAHDCAAVSDNLTVYYNSNTNASPVWTALTPPASTIGGSAAGTAVAFSPDGLLLFYCAGTGSRGWAISGSGASTTFSAAISELTFTGDIEGTTTGCSFSPDGTMIAVSHTTTPFVSIWTLAGSGAATVATELAAPAAIPTGSGNGVQFSPDGSFLAVAHTTSPFTTVYEISGTTFTKIDDESSEFAATLPTGVGSDVAFSRDGTWMAVAHTTTPFVSIYSIDSGAFTKVTNPSTLPDGNGRGVAFTTDNQYLAVVHATSPFLSHYKLVAGTWTKQSDPTAPDGIGNRVAFTPDNHEMVVAHDTSAFLTIYEAYNWLDADGTGATSTLADPLMTLVGTGYNEAKRVQAVVVTNTDKIVPHTITFGSLALPVYIKIGTTYDGGELVGETLIEIGSSTAASHAFTFTPNANLFFIHIYNARTVSATVTHIGLSGAGEISLSTLFDTDDLTNIRYAQSGDVVFVACTGVGQFKIKRFAEKSWGLTRYAPEDGPFRPLNTGLITLTPNALSGNIIVTASRPLFTPENATHTLIRFTSIGQNSDDDFTGANQFSATEIRVVGIGTQRNLSITRAGTWSATVTLQRSVAEPGAWTDVATFTTNGTATYNDSLDNQIIYYRIGIKTGDYTSGTAEISMNYASGGITGVVRLGTITSPTRAAARVLSPLGATVATADWEMGAWNDRYGWPSSVCLHEGRLWWAGMDRVFGSASDDYDSFDDEIEGDAGPIERSIGEGPVDQINWLLPLQRMLVGTEGSELSAKSNSFDEPLTPSNFTLKAASTHGSANVGAVKIDNSGLFVHRNEERLMQLAYDIDTYDYNTSDLTRLVPEICSGGIKRIAVQRLPDTRIHCVKNDGTVALLIYDRIEDVMGWVDIETDGLIEDVVVLPNTPEDNVYYVVQRTINSLTKRYLEKWAFEEDCVGAALNKQLDSFLVYSGTPVSTITGLSHLEGETVAAWGDANPPSMQDPQDLGTFVVTGGSITGLPFAVNQAVVGLPYTARYKSTKLAYAAAGGTALNMRKRLQKMGLVLYKTHAFGLRIGDDFDFLRGMPTMINNKAVDENEIYDTFDHDLNAYNTNWSTDSRICIEATAPRPATILALTFNIETNG